MATISLYHDTRSGKEEFPVKLRISHKKEKAYINIGVKVASNEWDGKSVIDNKKAKTYNTQGKRIYRHSKKDNACGTDSENVRTKHCLTSSYRVEQCTCNNSSDTVANGKHAYK